MKTTMKLEKITPAKAAEYLAGMGKNRKISSYHVEFIEEQLMTGVWEVNGETIKFKTDGTLVDGQHRLQACINTGKSFQTWVCRGLTNNAFHTIDMGRSRNFGDYLAAEGVKNSALTASAVRWLWIFEDPNRMRMRLSTKVALPILEANPKLGASVAYILQCGAQKLAPGGLCAAIHYRGVKRYKGAADRFFEQLGYGDRLGRTQPVFHLRQTLLGIRTEGVSWHRETMGKLVLKAWRATVKHERLKELSLNGEDNLKW